MSDLNENLTGHAYDGIEEYDNPLPGWWSALFIVCVIFAPGYLVFYHLGGDGASRTEAYEADAAAVFELRFAELGELEATDENVLKYAADPKWISVGRAVFRANCVSCHGVDAQGDAGPNLTDTHWKNVSKPADIIRVINEGAGNGSMPAWRTRLSHQNQVVLTAAYVASLQGSAPPNAKPAEGNEVQPWSRQ